MSLIDFSIETYITIHRLVNLKAAATVVTNQRSSPCMIRLDHFLCQLYLMKCLNAHFDLCLSLLKKKQQKVTNEIQTQIDIEFHQLVKRMNKLVNKQPGELIE